MKTHKMFRWPTLVTIQFLTLFAIHLFSTGLSAQTTTSTIEGTITDANGAVVAGAQVKAVSTTLGTERMVVAGSDGKFRIVSLPAGTYTITVTQSGFAPRSSELELTLNRTVTLDVQLAVGTVGGNVVNVSGEVPLLTTDSPATGVTVTPKQIQDFPVNGRNFLDLMGLVPGTAINRQADPEGDAANPVLGERSGNNNFFIDGHPNKDTVNGGPAAQFNQETISEFQVLTSGYKAEFGQASGAVVNVITKSGGNDFHGVASFFHRNDAFDSVNSLDPTQTSPPDLSRSDYSLALGGPVWNFGFGEGTDYAFLKDKFFFFGSAERITEDREIDFAYPDVGNATVNQLIRDLESQYDVPSLHRETRMFLKLNQLLGRHTLSQEMNYTNAHIKNFAPLSAGNSTPSTRNNFGSRTLMLAFGDTILLGDTADPWILNLRGSYRGEPSSVEPAHPSAGFANSLDPFAVPNCGSACILQSPLPNVGFGNGSTPSHLDQKYISLTAYAGKRISSHDIKFGWNFLRTKVDGLDSRLIQNQLFASTVDFAAFPPMLSGISLLADRGGVTPAEDEIHLNNNYNALFAQDDWRIRNNLTVSLGVRWDYDSEFEAKTNFGPRLGVTWAINPKTVVRAQFGQFFDQFRLGIAQNVPQFGGSNQKTAQALLFPRGLYGSPSFISSVGLFLLGSGPCFSNLFLGNPTDAQLPAGTMCPVSPTRPLIGVDRLNRVVANNHAAIPANSVLTVDTIFGLSGLTPDAYVAAANTAIGFPGFFFWGPTGLLTNQIIPGFGSPDALEHIDETPNTLGFSVGFQREITKDLFIEADYHHRAIRNILGLRDSNLAFRARLPGNTRATDPPGQNQQIGFGPYFEGTFDGLVISLNKRFSNHFTFGASYTYTSATDNSLGIGGTPSDSFIGEVPVVTQASNGATNANGSFTATNGNFVPQAGTFWNGPDVDKGPSTLALDHVFQANGMVSLPWDFQISALFRYQSGFHYSKAWVGSIIDPDGNGNTNGVDIRTATRNGFTAPAFVNVDVRFSKQFKFGERYKFDMFYEMFNAFNRQNPASINAEPGPTFGTMRQVLPGREGQIGFRFEF